MKATNYNHGPWLWPMQINHCFKNTRQVSGLNSDGIKTLCLIYIMRPHRPQCCQGKQILLWHSYVNMQPGLEIQIKPENYSNEHGQSVCCRMTTQWVQRSNIYIIISSIFLHSKSSFWPAANWHKNPAPVMCFSISKYTSFDLLWW